MQTPLDATMLARALAPVLRQLVAKETEPLIARIAELEAREPGKDGRNAYEVAVSLGYEGDVYSWMESLRGEPGANADSDQVAKAVSDYMAENPIPQPKDGASVTLEDVQPILDEAIENFSQVVRSHLDSIELPKDGTSVTVDDVRPILEAEVRRAAEELKAEVSAAVEAIPEPRSLTPEDVRPMVDELVQERLSERPSDEEISEKVRAEVDEAIAKIPTPKDGASVTVEDVAPLIERAVDERFAEIPRPKDGKDADMAAVMERLEELVAKAVEEIPAPKDGTSVTIEDARPILDAAFATWALEVERRVQDLAHRCIDRIEKPKDGKDAFEIDSFDVQVADDCRTVTFSVVRGEERIERSVVLPIPMHRGVFRTGDEYQQGDLVTFGGSCFIARRDTNSKPCTDDSWIMVAQRGRDGKK